MSLKLIFHCICSKEIIISVILWILNVFLNAFLILIVCFVLYTLYIRRFVLYFIILV